MPTYYAILAQGSGDPNAINAAFPASLPAPSQNLPIRWVGRARITQNAAVGILEIDGPYTQATLDAMAQQMAGKLAQALGPAWRASAQPYDASVNGDLSWWACLGYDASQCAAVTSPGDNPIGPNASGGSWVGPVLIGAGIVAAILLVRRASA